MPFNLHETEQFLQRKGLHYDRYQILQLYMTTGGILHYLKDIRPGFSLTQAIGLTTFGAKKNDAYLQQVQNQLTMDCLFEK